MKIHLLEITAIGPYAGTVEIDFDRLDESGVYLLTGPTGSGKTTVLDAISYALFACIPRATRGVEVVSDHRELTTTPKVVLEATVAGERLRVTRVPEHDRPKTKGEGTTTEKQTVSVEVHRSGEWKKLTDNWTEGNQELINRVGMTASQFNQVVMLPQGDFSKFLCAGARERQELLEKLFPGADLTWLEVWFKQTAARDREARDQKLKEIEDCFQAISPIAATLEAEDEDPLPQSAEAGPALIWIETTDSSLEKIAGRCASELERASAAAEAADGDLQKLKDRTERTRQRADAESRKKALDGKAGRRAALKKEVEAAESAAGVLVLARTTESKQGAAAAAADELTELGLAQKDDQLVGDLAPEDFKEERDQLQAKATTILNFENDDLPKRRELTGTVAGLETELAGISDDGPDSPAGQATALVVNCGEKANVAKQSLIKIRTARTRGMAAELALDLNDGEPCAVCGSTEHPSPAHAEGPTFTDKDEEEAAKEVESAEGEAARAGEALSQIKAELAGRKAKAESDLASAKLSLGKLEETEGRLSAGAASIGARREQLEHAIRLLTGLLNAERIAGETRAAVKTAESEMSREAKSRGFESVESAMEAACEAADLARLKTEAADYDKELAIVTELLEKRLKDVDAKEKLDLAPAQARAKAAAVERDEKSGASGVAASHLKTFRTEISTVPRLYGELKPLREAAATSGELDRLAGGQNERKMKLSIFVLATRLRQVIEVANKHLVRMSNQRYELLYSGDLMGNAMAGLGIEVFDAYTSETRPTSTLSGGEGFYASLALALGLAETVQAESGGKRLETLFIDEGFGTLDSKSLDQVMDVIDAMREGGRSVGLVSHVEELRNRIPAQIQVESTRDGSTLEIVAG